jgi:glycine/D-amino acid oxidase-like deaminating enzyme
MTGDAKIAIVGAGHAGVTLAYACLIRGTGVLPPDPGHDLVPF